MSPRDEGASVGGARAWTRTLYREIETGWSDEDDAYLARWVQYPDIGVQADGETREEAVANLISATGDYFGAIRADGSALRDGAEGAQQESCETSMEPSKSSGVLDLQRTEEATCQSSSSAGPRQGESGSSTRRGTEAKSSSPAGPATTPPSAQHPRTSERSTAESTPASTSESSTPSSSDGAEGAGEARDDFDPLTVLPGEHDIGVAIRTAVEHDAERMRFYLTCSVGELAQRIARLRASRSVETTSGPAMCVCGHARSEHESSFVDGSKLDCYASYCDCEKFLPAPPGAAPEPVEICGQDAPSGCVNRRPCGSVVTLGL